MVDKNDVLRHYCVFVDRTFYVLRGEMMTRSHGEGIKGVRLSVRLSVPGLHQDQDGSDTCSTTSDNDVNTLLECWVEKTCVDKTGGRSQPS